MEKSHSTASFHLDKTTKSKSINDLLRPWVEERAELFDKIKTLENEIRLLIMKIKSRDKYVFVLTRENKEKNAIISVLKNKLNLERGKVRFHESRYKMERANAGPRPHVNETSVVLQWQFSNRIHITEKTTKPKADTNST